MAQKRAYFLYPWSLEDRKQYFDYHLPFPVSEFKRRGESVKQKMREDKVDAVLLFGDSRQYGLVRWITNFYPQLGQSMVFITMDDENPILLTTASAHGEPMHSFVPESWVPDVRCGLFHNLPGGEHPTLLSLCIDAIKEKKLTKGIIGVASLGMLTYDLFKGMKEALPDVRWQDWSRSYAQVRAVKTQLEIETMERGAESVDAAFEAAFNAAKPGVSELEIAGILEYTARKNGINAVNNLFDTIVCSGPRAALKNGNPTERKLRKGDALFIDISMQYKGYAMDVSASHCIDAQPNKEQLALFETAAQMTEAMVANAKPGMPAKQMMAITREVAEQNGMGEWYCDYLCGHGIGACLLEFPYFDPESEDILVENMTFAVEPMVVHPVHGTGCVERMCAVGKDGGRLLSKLTFRPWTMAW